MQRLSALVSVDAAARLEFLHRLFQLTATIAILDRTKMKPRISLSDLVAMRLIPAMRCYAVKDVAGYFGRDATTISATLSRYNGKVEKQPEMRRISPNHYARYCEFCRTLDYDALFGAPRPSSAMINRSLAGRERMASFIAETPLMRECFIRSNTFPGLSGSIT